MFRIIGSFPTSRFDSLPLKMIRNTYSLRNSLNLLWNKDAKIWSVGNLDSFHEMPFCLILGCDQEQNERQLKKEVVRWPNTLKVGCVFPMVVMESGLVVESGPNDHREDAPLFTITIISTTDWVVQGLGWCWNTRTRSRIRIFPGSCIDEVYGSVVLASYNGCWKCHCYFLSLS